MSTLPSFRESLIVPLEVYEKKCSEISHKKEKGHTKKAKRTKTKKKRQATISADPTLNSNPLKKVIQRKKRLKNISSDKILSSNLPADLKVKLLDQQQAKVSLARKSKDYVENITDWVNVKEGVLQLFPEKDREIVRDIFEFALHNAFVLMPDGKLRKQT